MKKLILGLALVSIAALPVLAGENCKDKNKTACADKAKAECASKSACSKTPSKQAALSPKAAETAKN